MPFYDVNYCVLILGH